MQADRPPAERPELIHLPFDPDPGSRLGYHPARSRDHSDFARPVIDPVSLNGREAPQEAGTITTRYDAFDTDGLPVVLVRAIFQLGNPHTVCCAARGHHGAQNHNGADTE